MSNARMGHNSGSMWLHRSYNNVDQDPECDKFRAILRRERLKDGDVAALAGTANSTITRLREGETKQPRHATFAKIAAGIGYEYALTREDKRPDFEKEVAKAKEERKAYRAWLAKRRGNGNGKHKGK